MSYVLADFAPLVGLDIITERNNVIPFQQELSANDDLIHQGDKHCDDKAKVRSACEHLASTAGGILDRVEWVRIGHAIKNATMNYPEEGLALWHQVSKPYPGYSEAEAERAWDGFNPRGDGVGAGSLFQYAESLGWSYGGTGDGEAEGDIKNARAFARAAKGRFIHNPTTGKWKGYRDGQWSECEHGEETRGAVKVADRILERAVESVRREGNNLSPETKRRLQAALRLRNEKPLQAMLSLASAEEGMSATQVEFDADPWLLNCRNGVINLKDSSILAHDPEMLLSRRAEASYEESARCPRWEEFMGQTFADDSDTIDSIQRYLGYCLTGTVREEKLAFLYGTGANGKSVMASVLAGVYGTYCVTAPASMLEVQKNNSGPRPDIARLAGARLILANETAEGRTWDSATIKMIASYERVSTRFLHADFFEYQPTGKLLIRGNHKPIIRDSGDGMWRRLDLWHFKQQVPEDKRDPNLVDKLLEERDGVLRWLVEGCLKWQWGGLKQSKAIKDASGEYRHDCDIVGQWIDDECVTGADAEAEVGALYPQFQIWAVSSGLRAMSKQGFGRSLADRGMVRRTSNGRNYWRGIAPRPMGR